jgi:hypothetical protein
MVKARSRRKTQGSIGRATGGNICGAQRILRWSKALRSRPGGHFGDYGANDVKEGALVTGRSAAEEGKASKGESACEEGRVIGGNVNGRLKTR